MKKYVAFIVLAFATGAYAGSFTITTNAARDAKIARAVPVLGYANANALVQDLCDKAIVAGITEVDDGDVGSLADKARTANATQYSNACAALNGTVVNGRCR